MITKPRGKTKNSPSARPVSARREPQRTCVACRQVKAKHELVRLVRTVPGDIEIDATGKKPGRGAYFCPGQACLDKALQGKQLERVLKSQLTPANRERLIISGKELLKETGG